ncbi:MAG: hypothetical protein M1822_001755 [Bathelium mastoideum]|nr:MAG: hypothetical protein M1822_001755 [Bathelium mastoideum]
MVSFKDRLKSLVKTGRASQSASDIGSKDEGPAVQTKTYLARPGDQLPHFPENPAHTMRFDVWESMAESESPPSPQFGPRAWGFASSYAPGRGGSKMYDTPVSLQFTNDSDRLPSGLLQAVAARKRETEHAQKLLPSSSSNPNDRLRPKDSETIRPPRIQQIPSLGPQIKSPKTAQDQTTRASRTQQRTHPAAQIRSSKTVQDRTTRPLQTQESPHSDPQIGSSKTAQNFQNGHGSPELGVPTGQRAIEKQQRRSQSSRSPSKYLPHPGLPKKNLAPTSSIPTYHATGLFNREQLLHGLTRIGDQLFIRKCNVLMVAHGGLTTKDIDWINPRLTEYQLIELNFAIYTVYKDAPSFTKNSFKDRMMTNMEDDTLECLVSEALAQKIEVFAHGGLHVIAAPYIYQIVAKMERLGYSEVEGNKPKPYDIDDAAVYIRSWQRRSLQPKEPVMWQYIWVTCKTYRILESLGESREEVCLKLAKRINERYREKWGCDGIIGFPKPQIQELP